MDQVQFAGYDSSLLVDAGWRMNLGQLPYRDFPCMLPPSFYLLAKLAIRVFGTHWYSVTLLNALFTGGLLLAGSHLYERLYRFRPSQERRVLGIYVVAILSPLLVTSHLWHSAFAAQINTLLLFVLLLLYEHWKTTGSWDKVGLAYSIVAFGCVFLEKPNTGLICLGVTFLFTLLASRRIQVFGIWLGVSLSGLALASLLLAVASLDMREVLRSYLKISNRPSPLRMLVDGVGYEQSTPGSLSTITAYVLLLALLFAGTFLILRRDPRIARSRIAVAAAGLFLSCIGFATNWDLKYIDLSPGFFGLGALLGGAHLDRRGTKNKLNRLLQASVLLYFTMALLLGGIRARMQVEGDWATEASGPTSIRFDRFFGWFAGRSRFWQVLSQSDDICRQHGCASVYYGPRLEFLYARNDLPSPKRLPIWWHPGSSYPMSEEAAIISCWKQSRFQTVVLLASDTEGRRRIPAEILQELELHYDLISAPADVLEVYRRKQTS